MNSSTKMVWRSLLSLGLALSAAGCVGADGGDLEGDDELVASSALGHEATFGGFPGGAVGNQASLFGDGRPSPYGGVQGGLYSHSFPAPSHLPPPIQYPPSSYRPPPGGCYSPPVGNYPPLGGYFPGGYTPPRGGYCPSGGCSPAGGGYLPPGGGGGYLPPAGGGCGK